MLTPSLTHVFDILAEVGTPIVIGETREGTRRVIPITGGTVRGPRLSGVILPGGADYQVVSRDDYLNLEARYVISLDDGALIYVVNTGVRFGPPEVIARMARGEPVDPALVYFRTVPRFETTTDSYLWLTRPLFLATGARYPDRVQITVFQVG